MSDEDQRSITITRDFDAPPHIVFKAHSAPDHVRRWFGPKGWPLTLCEMDFRVGGQWRFAMTGPDGKQNPAFGGEYLEIVPDARIVYDNAFQLPGAEKMVTTVTFEPLPDDRTRLLMRTVFANLAMHATHIGAGFESGVNSGLDQLEEVVAELVATQG
jgi:uncharacterized protein YndB with AHSA1/START domain